jgi:hypothetical protein
MDVCIMMRRLNKTTPRNKLDGEEAPEHDDEVEQEEEVPEEEEQPHYTTYNDIFELEGNIINMNNLANNLRDTAYNLSQQFALWNRHGHDGTHYPPPQ